MYCNHCGTKQVAEPRPKRARSNGTGTAYKRGRTWTGQASGYSIAVMDGDRKKLIRKRPTKGGFATKTEALTWANSYNPAEQSGRDVTLQDLWTGWSANDMLKLSKDKIVAYKKARERLEPVIGRKIADLSLDDLQRCVNNQSSSYYTARDMKSLLSHLYKRAMAANGGNGPVTVNLARMLVLPDLEEKEPDPFTEQEIEALWRGWEGGTRFAGYILLMIYTSMMPGELMKCRKSMIDWDRREIYGAGLKTRKRRETPIVLPDFILPVLRDLADASGTEKLLPGDEKTFYARFHATLSDLGIRPLQPYSCRHTTATAAVKKGIALPVVQQIMRHAKISSTQRYVHVASEEAHAAVDALKTR